MDIKLVRELAEVLKEMNLSTIEVEEGELKIKIENAKAESEAIAPQPAPLNSTQFVVPDAIPDSNPGLDFNSVHTVDSPMVGVFYAAPNPDSEPYVTLGSKVKKGDVLCIIEAMKLMNEIVAETDGEIVDVCVSNGDVVEYGQTLFKIF